MTAVKDKVKSSRVGTGTNTRIHTHSPFYFFRHVSLILWSHPLFLENAFSPPLECQVAEKIQVIIIFIITLQVINFCLMKYFWKSLPDSHFTRYMWPAGPTKSWNYPPLTQASFWINSMFLTQCLISAKTKEISLQKHPGDLSLPQLHSPK